MSQTTTPSGALVCPLSVMDEETGLMQRRAFSRDELERHCDARTAVAALIARNAELEADAGRWREVSDKAWFIDAAAYVYGLRTGTFDPSPDEDEVIAAIDAARKPAMESSSCDSAT